MFIKPMGFDEMHDRHGIQHRLKDETQVAAAGHRHRRIQSEVRLG